MEIEENTAKQMKEEEKNKEKYKTHETAKPWERLIQINNYFERVGFFRSKHTMRKKPKMMTTYNSDTSKHKRHS